MSREPDLRSIPALPNLPNLPDQGQRPVFKEPWEAQAFAIAYELQQAGHFSWAEWSEELGRVIEAAQRDGDPDLGDTYYEHWLSCLETIVADKGLLTSSSLEGRREQVRQEHERLHHPHPHHEPVVDDAPELPALIERHLRDPASAWSIGILGAIGEFSYDADERVVIETSGSPMTALSARGAIAVQLVAGVRCIACPATATDTEAGARSLAFCLPERATLRPIHRGLSELGPDRHAVTADKRRDILFDLGLGSPYLRFCIRSADPELLALLRSALGSSLLDPGNPATQAILRISPHRVVLSGLGRVEVYQAIPAAGGREDSPLGPHTHLLPELLATQRTHRETLPIPSGWVPGLMLYKPHDPGSTRPSSRRQGSTR